MTDSKEKRWQDHPVVIAAGSFGAALVFAQTVIFPTMTASLQNEVSSLRNQAQEVRDLREQLTQANDAASKEKGRLETIIKEAQLANIFSLDNPYPIGHGKVKIGDPVATIQANFPELSIDRLARDVWMIKTDHAAFKTVAYYFDSPKDLKDRRVRAILFFATDALAGALHGKLIESIGQPMLTGPKPDCYIWAINPHLFVKQDAPNSFNIDTVQRDCKVEEK